MHFSLGGKQSSPYNSCSASRPKSLPQDPAILQQMLMDLTTQLDKTQRLLRQLLEAKSGTHSEQLSADQLRLFGRNSTRRSREAATETHKDDDLPPGSSSASQRTKTTAVHGDAASTAAPEA